MEEYITTYVGLDVHKDTTAIAVAGPGPGRARFVGTVGSPISELLKALAKLTAPQRRYLLEILEDRYQRRSTLVTSQLPVEHWHKTIGEPTHADAILDRLVHNAYRIALRGESMRKLNAKGGMRLNDKS